MRSPLGRSVKAVLATFGALGHLDGEVRNIDIGDDGNPPERWEFDYEAPDLVGVPSRFVFLRESRQRDDGPRWLYRQQPQDANI